MRRGGACSEDAILACSSVVVFTRLAGGEVDGEVTDSPVFMSALSAV